MQALFKRLPALVLAASVAWTVGCGIETKVVGVVAEPDLNTLETMKLLARGTNSELTDIFAACYYAEMTWKPTDEAYIGSTSSYDARIAASDFSDRPAGSCYSQATEAAWAALYSVQKISEVDKKFDINPDSDPLVARMWLNGGLGERQLGEMFCEANFNYGPEGGILLKGNNPPYDPGEIVSNDSIFRRVIYYADQAIPIAQAALAANAEVIDDWYLFDPQVILTSAYGLKAQAYLLLEEWDLADEFAAKALAEPMGTLPPTEGNIWSGGAGIDFIEYTHYNDDTEDNDTHQVFHRDDEGGLWNTPAVNQWEGDPRIPLVRCGEFKPGVVPGGSKSSSDFINYSSREGCSLEISNEYRNENNMYPRYVQLKYVDRGSDYEMVTGTEMVLIRAEVALRKGDLAGFTTFINQERAHYGLDPIEQPATAGALEYPNAEDDAWSILDRERYLELWLEGRRFKDMWRWNHPYWTDPEGHFITQEQAAIGANGPRAFTCYPMPSNECQTNPLIRTTETCKILQPPGAGE